MPETRISPLYPTYYHFKMCPRCGRKASIRASVCAHCHRAYRGSGSPETGSPERKAPTVRPAVPGHLTLRTNLIGLKKNSFGGILCAAVALAGIALTAVPFFRNAAAKQMNKASQGSETVCVDTTRHLMAIQGTPAYALCQQSAGHTMASIVEVHQLHLKAAGGFQHNSYTRR